MDTRRSHSVARLCSDGEARARTPLKRNTERDQAQLEREALKAKKCNLKMCWSWACVLCCKRLNSFVGYVRIGGALDITKWSIIFTGDPNFLFYFTDLFWGGGRHDESFSNHGKEIEHRGHEGREVSWVLLSYVIANTSCSSQLPSSVHDH
jgi:hypothetical protein